MSRVEVLKKYDSFINGFMGCHAVDGWILLLRHGDFICGTTMDIDAEFKCLFFPIAMDC
jgi:hypothetical protein